MIAVLHSVKRGRAWHVEFDDEVVVVASQDPEFDLARALVARKLTGSCKIIDGETGTHRSTITNIEKAARLRTEEGPHGPRCVKRRERHVDQALAGATALVDYRVQEHLSPPRDRVKQGKPGNPFTAEPQTNRFIREAHE